MTKRELIRRIEEDGRYFKVLISAAGEISGMLCDEDYPYHTATNTGGRRYIGEYKDTSLQWYCDRCYDESEVR